MYIDTHGTHVQACTAIYTHTHARTYACTYIPFFAHDPLSSSGYPLITYIHPIASNLLYNVTTMVARQLQTHTYTHNP